MKGQSPPPLQKARFNIKRPAAGQRASRMRRSQPMRPRTSLVPPPIKSFLVDPDCCSLRESILSSSEPYDFSQLDTNRLSAFVSHLREYEQKLAREENYPEASVIRELGDEAREELLGRASEEAGGASQIQAREASIQGRQAQQKVESEREWEEKIEKYKQETTEKREKMEELHEQQRERFEKKWQESKPSQYRKPSARLLQLKYVEKNMAKHRNYDEAEAIHAEADKLMRQECEMAQKALVSDYKSAKEKLLKRQELERQQFEYARGEGLKMLENQFKESRDKAERRDQVITAQKASVNSRAMKLAAMSASQPTPVKKRGLRQELLPPLIPPNDPKFVEEEERKARAENKRRLELQRKKEGEVTSRWCSSKTSPCPSKTPSDDEDSPSPKSKTTKPASKKPLKSTPKKSGAVKQETPQQESQDTTLGGDMIKEAFSQEEQPGQVFSADFEPDEPEQQNAEPETNGAHEQEVEKEPEAATEQEKEHESEAEQEHEAEVEPEPHQDQEEKQEAEAEQVNESEAEGRQEQEEKQEAEAEQEQEQEQERDVEAEKGQENSAEPTQKDLAEQPESQDESESRHVAFENLDSTEGDAFVTDESPVLADRPLEDAAQQFVEAGKEPSDEAHAASSQDNEPASLPDIVGSVLQAADPSQDPE